MRLRLTVLATGIGALLTGPAVCAQVLPPPPEDQPVTSSSTAAMTLLERAAQAWGSRAWSGTQQVLTTRGGLPRLSLLRVSHTPGAGSDVQVLTTSDRAVTADVLDATLLSLLAGHYDLHIAGTAWCAARRAVVVDARRLADGVPGSTAGSLAGRFWVDETTGLVLRRDVLDDAGSVVRSSSFTNLRVAPTKSAPVVPVEAGAVHPDGQHLDDAALDSLAEAGWPVVRTLPAQMELFDARLHDTDGGDVVQLSYSDGLSTLSLFVQKGALPGGLPGRTRTMGGGQVLVSHDVLERVVWSGGGRTWTLVSDAPESVVDAAVAALPHARARPDDDGLVPRLWRGMSRVGSWLNPFE